MAPSMRESRTFVPFLRSYPGRKSSFAAPNPEHAYFGTSLNKTDGEEDRTRVHIFGYQPRRLHVTQSWHAAPAVQVGIFWDKVARPSHCRLIPSVTYTPRSKFSSAISPGSRKRVPRLVSFVTLLSASAVRGLAVRQRREDECQSF